jgi:hypothetical protein
MYINAHALNPISIGNCRPWRITHSRYVGRGYTGAELRVRWLGLIAIKGPVDRVMPLFCSKGLSMTSNQSIAITTAFVLGLAFVPIARADPASEACAALLDARTALYSMISPKDKSAQDALNAKVQASSTKLDSVLAGMTGADATVATRFKAVWEREKEIIPAIYKGNAADAKKLTDGIQHDRLSKMWSIMSCR